MIVRFCLYGIIKGILWAPIFILLSHRSNAKTACNHLAIKKTLSMHLILKVGIACRYRYGYQTIARKVQHDILIFWIHFHTASNYVDGGYVICSHWSHVFGIVFYSFVLSSVHHYGDVIMGAIASQITNLTIVCSTVYSDADQRKHKSSASLAFVRGIQWWPVNSPHKWPVTRKMFPFDDVIMLNWAMSYQMSYGKSMDENVACRRCSNYIFIVDSTYGCNRLWKTNCKTIVEHWSFVIWCDLY